MEFAAGEHGLEDRCGVDGAFGGAGADECVDLVDEQQNVAASLDFFEYFLEAFFEITAVAAAGHKRTEVKRVELHVGQRVGARRC